jgi:acetyltransferase-like isoleucine patch superfamily enzyme
MLLGAKFFLLLRKLFKLFWRWCEYIDISARFVAPESNFRLIRIQNGAAIQNPIQTRNNIELGSNVIIDGILNTYNGKGKIKIGDYSYVGPNTRIWSYDSIVIGSHVQISHNCNVFDSNTHPTDAKQRRLDYYNIIFKDGGNQNDEVVCKPTELENDVWIGCNVCIMKGVTIGARSIVAAGSVLTKSIPSDVIVAGNPAKIVKILEVTPPAE